MKELFIDEPDKIRAFKFDLQAPYLKYVGVSQNDADPAKLQWRIYRETIVGTVFTREFANFGKYLCSWNNRASYFGTPPGDPGTIPTEDFVNVNTMPQVDLEDGLATEATLSAVLNALATIPTVYRSATATLVTPVVNVTNAGQIIAPANPNRKAFYIWNNSANSGYVTLGSTPSSATCPIIIATFQSYISNGPVCYTGPISAIRNGAATGNMAVTEII